MRRRILQAHAMKQPQTMTRAELIAEMLRKSELAANRLKMIHSLQKQLGKALSKIEKINHQPK
jgi:predicted hydrocarbon binding protein